MDDEWVDPYSHYDSSGRVPYKFRYIESDYDKAEILVDGVIHRVVINSKVTGNSNWYMCDWDWNPILMIPKDTNGVDWGKFLREHGVASMPDGLF